MMKQHLAILCDNKPGVLTHVAGLISRRAINIEYINAGYTEEPDVTRINIVVSVEDQRALNQAILHQGLPFAVQRPPSRELAAALAEGERLARDPDAKTYSTPQELWDELGI